MSKPQEEVKEKEYFKDIHFLYEILGSLRNVEEVKLFIKDIHTRSELRMFKRRWHIANLLLEGHDIRTVADKAKTSTQTVSRIKKVLEEGYGGLKLAIERVNAKAKKDEQAFLKSKSTKGGSKFVKGWFR
jgi:TrpR-related protein YerC/YecD